MLGTHDLTTEAGRTEAYASVVAAFQKEYGGAHVLIKPADSDRAGQLGWVVPYVLVAAGLALVYAAGRRWVRRGRADMAAKRAAPSVAAADAIENEDYADKLDDELRNTD